MHFTHISQELDPRVIQSFGSSKALIMVFLEEALK
jgi:hypothetical protein